MPLEPTQKRTEITPELLGKCIENGNAHLGSSDCKQTTAIKFC